MEAVTTPINWELESEGWRKRYHEKDNELQQAEGRIKELEASDKWISVKDGLPEDLEDVLACHIEAGGIEICYYSHEDKKWWATDDNDGFERIISHYQYLPKPPIK